MALDVYQPCPFCIDKKLKFCCASVAEEMEKVGRLSESGQGLAAMKILDKLAKTNPNTVWNEATRAMFLLGDGRSEEAKAILDRLHSLEPENQSVIALLGTTAFATQGYAAARDSIYKAFRKAQGRPDLLSSLALAIAGEMFDGRKYLAARQHLTLAMRFAVPQEKQSIFVRLLEFDGNSDIPYPLRSVHSLREVAGDADRQDSARKAMRLAERGCFGPAAERFVHLAQQTPDDPAVEYDIALCTAWEGDEEVAAEAFGRAALAEPDFELAAEYEALEQLLRANLDGQPVRMRNAEYRVSSASRLITDLRDHARFVRFALPPEAAGDNGMPDAVFELLDRPMPEAGASLTPVDLPRAIGQIAVFGSPADADEPRAALAAFEGTDFETAKSLLAQVEPGLELVEERSEEGDATLPRELAPLHARLAFPESTSVKTRRDLERARWASAIDEIWMRTPQEALIGKSPADAASDEGLRAPLAGAIYVLDAFCLRNRYALDVNEIRRKLGLPEVAPVEGKPNLPLNTTSAIQLHRITVGGLADRQLSIVINRSLLVHHGRFLEVVLEEALRRSLPDIDRNRIYLTLSDVARDRGDLAGALRWVDEGRKEARTGEQAFENIFRWDTKELGLRLEDPTSPDVDPFVRRMSGYYGPKVPRFTDYLDGLLRSVGLTPPSILEPVGAAAGASGGLWTPDQPAGGSEKKLWIPGT